MNKGFGVGVDFSNVKLWKRLFTVHEEEYTPIKPFLGPNITIKIKRNIYIGVKKKLTNQQPRTNKEIKSSLNTWKSKNSFPRKPAL